MKSRIIFTMLMLFLGIDVYGSSQLIVCGNDPGEIYFVGVHPRLPTLSGLYYSHDFGETIQLRYSHFDLGRLLADAQDSTLYDIFGGFQYLSENGGIQWTPVNTSESMSAYASGNIPGEVYRRTSYNHSRLERSLNYGYDYLNCGCLGFPDSLFIFSTALGIDSGEVYIWSYNALLYYSNNCGESFTFIADLYSTFGVYPWSYIINGAEPGETFIFHLDTKKVWRVFNYGNSAELIIDFSPYCDFGNASVAASRQPGELYFLAVHENMSPGGTIHIFHTTNYFQDWTMSEHIIEWENIEDQISSFAPYSINLHLWPNPTNAFFSISYELKIAQNIRLGIYNILGQTVWSYCAGPQSPGTYQITFKQEQLSSGKYFLLLQTDREQVIRQVAFVK